MQMTWFAHDPVDTATANELISRYTARNIQTQKTLATDPRLWLVSAYLPEYREEPIPSKTYQHVIWSQ